MTRDERDTTQPDRLGGSEQPAAGDRDPLAPFVRSEDPPALADGRYQLTARQREVALLLTRRLTNAEIADALGVSVHTVRHHVEAVLRKLAVRSRREVAAKLLAD